MSLTKELLYTTTQPVCIWWDQGEGWFSMRRALMDVGRDGTCEQVGENSSWGRGGATNRWGLFYLHVAFRNIRSSGP